ncbi:predicted protein [Sclerotinia sclerotiorum 1980 UF-70]|uniref:Uncharacterized protein n=1 Tax=Sclerotinia sclerotiorum (strain ATCC 18683 / 1980 / Ss-1) TaxID=665079 RepID=A7ERQ6_SCLS1|nr:predicted protein [Sclerotinia sclerotiorum 1980 UF-70]EDN92148.1 predicted protein [Sclerotinia sclerotiorum 1980 UF-70]
MEHFCDVCHRRRSWRYHLQHPITSGTSPTSSICTRCSKNRSREPPFHKLKASIESPALHPSSHPPQSSLPSSSVIYERLKKRRNLNIPNPGPRTIFFRNRLKVRWLYYADTGLLDAMSFMGLCALIQAALIQAALIQAALIQAALIQGWTKGKRSNTPGRARVSITALIYAVLI